MTNLNRPAIRPGQLTESDLERSAPRIPRKRTVDPWGLLFLLICAASSVLVAYVAVWLIQ